MTDSGSGYSHQDPEDSSSDYALRQFQIDRTLARVRTMVLVKVISVKGGAGAIAKPPMLAVQPLVKLIDGQGNSSSHGTINNVPVFRYGAGTFAVICDPIIGDIGWCAIADRDISAVKSTGAEATPGSRRMFDLADAVYMGSLLSGVPDQYVTFTANGMKMADKNNNTIVMESDGIKINGLLINQQGQVAGDLPVTGSLDIAGSINALNGSEYAGNISTLGTVSGSDMIANPGGSQVTLRGHISSSAGTPPTPGH